MMLAGCTKTETIPAPAEEQNRILQYSVVNVQGDPIYGAVNDADSTIKIYLPFYLQLTILEPEIRVSEGATVDPVSGTMIEDLMDVFLNGRDLRYKVTAKNGAVKTYTLEIEVQQPPVELEEISPGAAEPVEYVMDTSQIFSSVRINLKGTGFSENHDLVKVVLVDAAGAEVTGDLAVATTNTNDLNSLTVDITKYQQNVPEVLKHITWGGLYRIRVYSYARSATTQFPIRISKP